MPTFEELKITAFDHVEFAVADLDRSVELYLKMGFEKLGMRESRERQLRSFLMGQNDLFILLSQSTAPGDPVAQYVQKHGDGIINVAFRCEDAASAVDMAARRGATVLIPPRTIEKDFGSVAQASIAAVGDVRHTFISRQGPLFAEGFDTPYPQDVRGNGLLKIDHITIFVESGQKETWKSFYENVFGFTGEENPRDTSSLIMKNALQTVRLSIAQPSPENSQIQDFLDMHHGAGVEHVAFASQSILSTLQHLKTHGTPLKEVADSYYGELPKRIHYFSESLADLKQHQVLVHGDGKGYLLQSFTKKLVGPLGFEIIQRKGDESLGEG